MSEQALCEQEKNDPHDRWVSIRTRHLKLLDMAVHMYGVVDTACGGHWTRFVLCMVADRPPIDMVLALNHSGHSGSSALKEGKLQGDPSAPIVASVAVSIIVRMAFFATAVIQA